MRLGDLSTITLAELLAGAAPVVALVPVGSVEPHGPHLPLATDTLIGEEVAARAAAALGGHGVQALVAPSLPYGVTDFATGFAGAIGVPASTLAALLKAIVERYLADGFAYVCLINNHLEPAHDQALRRAVDGLDRAGVACPLTRRWGRTLSAEYKSGACHAGRYETSLVLAAREDLVDRERAASLPPLTTSLSEGIRAGHATFAAMGLDQAYTGAPADASIEEGAELLGSLVTMVVTEVTEALARTGRGR